MGEKEDANGPQPDNATSDESGGQSNPIKDIELLFGLVGPTGVDLTAICNALKSQLVSVDYEPVVISLSDLIPGYINKKFSPITEYHRIKELMSIGTDLRAETDQPDIVGRLGIAKIRAIRQEKTGDRKRPAARVAYIIRSFKRPEEVELYRDVYGKAFTLISVYSPRTARIKHMERKFSKSARTREKAGEYAVELINRDYAEEGGKKYGQSVGDTFPIADYFITSGAPAAIDKNIRRLMRLIFGDPYIAPTRDEQGMFFAQA